MKKIVDIVSIIVVSVFLMFALKKIIQLGSAKPEPPPPTAEELAAQQPEPQAPQAQNINDSADIGSSKGIESSSLGGSKGIESSSLGGSKGINTSKTIRK
ncbi:MAG: hypothetical protein L3J71_12310 [Victivallaceae bacterium]|nr:hypothetical protein [Victivallaceae bacterium]